MRSGRSSSEAARRIHAAVAALALGAIAFLPRAGLAQFIPPPPENLDTTPTPAPKKATPNLAQCPRCGYLCDPGWHYCVACGWDLTRLVGDAEETRLQSVARSSVGVIVGGRKNRYATAFPYGGPGLFLTNARVLIGSDEGTLRVRTFNNLEIPATTIGYDLPSGVGLIKADVPAAGRIEIASASPAPPESAWAVCYPIMREDDLVRYLPVSLHRGEVTAAGQTGSALVSFENLLRTDHTIEQGCTGGPLIDSRGRVAGMILDSRDAGITYTLPLQGLEAVVGALGKGLRPERPFFGIGLVTPDERRRAKYALRGSSTQPLVAYLIPGSPAAQAGVRPGDLLLSVGGEHVTSVLEAGQHLLATTPGGPGVPLALERGGGEAQAIVQPVKRPERVLLDPIDELQETLEANLKEVSTGPGAQQGLLVTDLVRGGRGEKLGHFKNGDLIVSVDKKSVRTFEAFDEIIRTKFKEIFTASAAGDKQYASSYGVNLEVRVEGQDKVTREYVNAFPDFLAPPVY